MKENRYLANLDWLEMYFIGNLTPIDIDIECGNRVDKYQINKHFQLIRSFDNRHPSFEYCFNIIIRGQNVGYLFYCNNGKYRFANADTIQVRIVNHILYQSGLSALIHNIEQTLSIKFDSFYRLDIAIDGYNIIQRHNELTESPNFKRKRAIMVSGVYDEKNKTHSSFMLGAKKSDKKITIYPKQQQIALTQKHYISEFWAKNKLKIKNSLSIDRIELRLNSKALRNFKASFEELENPHFLTSVFKSNAGDILEFINNSDKSHREHVVDWSCFKPIDIKKPKTTHKPIKTNQYKPMMKLLFVEILRNVDLKANEKIDNNIVETMTQVAFKYDLCDWTKNSIPKWGKEFLRNKLIG